MSAPNPQPRASELVPLTESDGAETVMTYDPDGKTPAVVGTLWAMFAGILIGYLAIHYVPDLGAWTSWVRAGF